IDRAFKNTRRNLKLRAPSIPKEQISVCLRYVNKEGQVRKHFLIFVHVSNMTKTIEALQSEKISSRCGLNQEIALKRAADTRWGSHYETILRLISLFSSVVKVLEYGEKDGNNSEQRAEACHLLNIIQPFEFIFNLHLMKNILVVTNELSQMIYLCHKKDQDAKFKRSQICIIFKLKYSS
ncbi:hypothetical protein HN873_016371, partial [Arachis hypogaea]